MRNAECGVRNAEKRAYVALGIALLAALAAAAPAAERTAGRIYTLDQLPAPVKVAILNEAEGETIESAFITLQSEPPLYLAAVTTERKSLMLEVAPEGKVVHIVIRRPQTLDAVPAPVKAAIEKEAAGAALRSLTATEEDGRLSYSAELETREKSVSLVLDRAGKLLDKAARPILSRDGKGHENEPEIPGFHPAADELRRVTVAVNLGEVPAPVKTAILKEANGAEVQDLARVTEGGKTCFRAAWSRPGKDTELRVDPEGKIVGTVTTEKLALDQVGGGARAAIQKELAGGKVESIERVTNNGLACYLVKLAVARKEIDLILDSTGRVLRKDVGDAAGGDEDPADKR